MKNLTKKISLTILGILLVYSAVAFALKAAIGVLPVDAAITSVATLIGMKVGTFSMLFHGSFFVGQILIEKKNFRKTELLQLLIGRSDCWYYAFYPLGAGVFLLACYAFWRFGVRHYTSSGS